MESALTGYEVREMSIGRVFQRAFSAIAFNPIVILTLALVVGALPGVIMSYLFLKLGIGSADAVRSGALSTSGLFAATMISALVTMVISALVQGALTRATVAANEGKRATIGESLAGALRVIFPLIGLSILWALGVSIGLILIVVPGIILMLMWAVAVPALVVEREGIFAAFRRSAELTKGARWKIFGLTLVMLVIYWLLYAAAALVGLGTYGSAGTSFTAASLAGSIIVGTIFNMVWGTIQPSLYVELRQWKGDDSLQNLEEVFA